MTGRLTSPARSATRGYHGSRDALPIGTRLEARGQNLLDGDIEAALEAARPAHRLARDQAVYATPAVHHLENLTAIADHVYAVEIVDGVVLDHAYANRIWQLFAARHEPPDAATRARIDALARLYWSGRPARFPGALGVLCPYAPEILCREARVIADLAPRQAA